MKKIILIVAALSIAGGCASRQPHAEGIQTIEHKQEELRVLGTETSLVVQSILSLQAELARSSNAYSADAAKRDLDRAISVLQRACDDLAAENRQLERKRRVLGEQY